MLRSTLALFALTISPNFAPGAEGALSAAQLAQKIGSDRGIWVFLDRQPGRLPLELAAGTKRLIYVQSPEPAAVDQLRAAADRAGLLGRQVYVEQRDPRRIHLADGRILCFR